MCLKATKQHEVYFYILQKEEFQDNIFPPGTFTSVVLVWICFFCVSVNLSTPNSHRGLPDWWQLLNLMTLLGSPSSSSKGPLRTPADFLRQRERRRRSVDAQSVWKLIICITHSSNLQRWLQHFSYSSASEAKTCRWMGYVFWKFMATISCSSRKISSVEKPAHIQTVCVKTDILKSQF